MAETQQTAAAIIAADFEPTPEKPPRGRSFISWVQIFLAILSLALAFVLWFVFTSKSVKFEVNIADAELSIDGGLFIQTGARYLMQPGEFSLKGVATGYHDLTTSIEVVTDQDDQIFQLNFERLPGVIDFSSEPIGTEVYLNDELIGRSPFQANVPAGLQTVTFSMARYIPVEMQVQIEGRHVQQSISAELDPDWALVTLPTQPSGVAVSIDGEESGFTTPGPIEVLSGERVITLKKPGYTSWFDILFVRAGEVHELEEVVLEPAGGAMSLSSDPPSAVVIVNGEYQGVTPVTLDIQSGSDQSLELTLAGYQQESHQVNLRPGEQRDLHVPLREVIGQLSIETDPTDVEIWIDGEFLGTSNATLSLHAIAHTVELKKEGYASYQRDISIQPELTHRLRVRLLTHEEARLEALRQVRQTVAGQEILLFEPSPIRMGAPRSQPGARANENFRTANLNRLFYLSVHEVTNAEYRQFAAGHDSGDYHGKSLNGDDQPVVNVSWEEAALYCNYLSEEEGLEPFYRLRGIEVIGFNPNALGYRLPAEAEWAWAARHVEGSSELLIYPWGTGFPPPERHGNYADKTAQHLVAKTLFNYKDNYIVTAPVGTFVPNSKGLYDMGGNVAEWVHDYHAYASEETEVPVLGPDEGEYHVIRGSSFIHGTITDLRLSFRDYGNEGKADRGFRIARFAE